LGFAVVVGGGFLGFVCNSSSKTYSKMTLNRLCVVVSLRFVPQTHAFHFSLSHSKFRHDDPDNNPDNPDNNESVQ